MDQIWMVLTEFYKNNKDLAHILIGALAGSILMLLLKSIHRILDGMSAVIILIGKKIGGSLAYKSFINAYMNWMVVEYQDLNLTGIIGSGPKPKLEQIFISLSLTGQSEVPTEEPRGSLIKVKKMLGRIGLAYQREKTERPQKPISRTETFYEKRRAHRITCFFERNEALFIVLFLFFLLFVVVGFFILLPAYLLFWSHTLNVWLVVIAGSISWLAVILLFWGLFASIKEEENIGIIITISSLVVYTLIGILLVRTNGVSFQRAILTLAGATLSTGIFSIWWWTKSRTRGVENESAKRMHQLLDQYNNIAVLGKPGAGKSTFVQFLALTFAREKAGDRKLRKRNVVKEKLGLDIWYFPILIPLRKVAKALQDRDSDGSTNLLLEVWRDRTLPSDIRADFPDNLILRMLKKRNCILLLDGLDEVSNDEEFRTVIREIRGFSSRYSGNKFVITSRFSGWRGGVGSAFQEFQVDDLSEEQINNFIGNWYQAIEENRVLARTEAETPSERAQRFRKARSRAADLKKALQEVEGIHTLAENPLLLSLICFVHYNQSLPRERLSLYQECSKLLLMQWDLEKGLVMDDTDLTLRRKEAIMQELAFSMHTEKIGQEFGGKEATSDEIIPIVEEKLRQFRLPVENARSLFQKLVDRSGIIVSVERYTDRYSFSHLTFQEFYTAKHIFENQLNILNQFIDESAEKLADWWREVLLLYVSMVKDSSRLIQKICRPSLGNLDDLLNKRLQVAAQCLLHAVAVQDQTIEQAILQSLLDIRLEAKGDISISSGHSRELKTYLLRFANTSGFYEHALRFAMKEIRGSFSLDSIVAKLLEFSKSPDSDLAQASLTALEELANTCDLSTVLPLDKIVELFEHQSERVKIAVLRFVGSQPGLLIGRSTLEKVISFLFDYEDVKLLNERNFILPTYNFSLDIPYQFVPLGFYPRYIPYGFVSHRFYAGHLKALRHIVKQLPRIPYQNESDREWVRTKLWEIFRESVDRRSIIFELYESARLRDEITAAIVLLSDDEKRLSYTSQFLDMLQTGSQSDQLFAARVLSLLLQEIKANVVVDILIEALRSPYSEVRSTVMETLGVVSLSPGQLEKSVSILETGLRTFPFLQKASVYLNKAFAGKGQVGADFSEKINLIRSLKRLNAHSLKDFEVRLLSIAETDRKYIANVLKALADDFDYELDSQVVSRLIQMYRDYGDSRSNLWKPLVELGERLSIEDKKRLEQILFDEFMQTQPEYLLVQLLECLCDLKVGLISISNNARARLLGLLEHRNWNVADAAFEVVVQYRML